MAPTIIGNTGAVYQGYTSNWQAYDGASKEMIYRGPATAIEALAAQFRALVGPDQKDTVRVSVINGRAELRVSAVSTGSDGGSIDIAVPLYELEGNDVRKRAELSPYFKANLTAQEILDCYTAYDKAVAVAAFDGSDVAKSFYSRVCAAAGEPEYLDTAPVLRETITTTRRSVIRASYTHINHQMRTSRLQGEVADWSACQAQIGALPDMTWLKRFPRTRQYGRKRWQIVTEYWGAQGSSATAFDGWDALYYPALT